MTVLAAAQTAGLRLLGQKPGSLFSTSDPFALELAELATDVAREIAEAHDWRLLTELHTIEGDGTSIAHALADDYGRMPKKQKVHSRHWKTANFRLARDLDEWLYFLQYPLIGAPGQWILLDGKLQINPPMPIGEAALYYYIRNGIVTDASGTAKPAFTADTDEFVLPQRLLELGLIWRWRSQKRLEYSEDMTNYEIALQRAITADKGSQMLVVGRTRLPTGVSPAFPGTLGS
ncbi:hypothetical protein [Rhodopseudomonas sp. BR0G17]|uniref:hypothetical protein n=1 Tax=Rhodopseudomonas sp. BR0G17 TaxID=2269368 RepID=UPI0013E09D9E|nr:hypothetical protein [Rhodopseudomonas sp. BR0G17]NEW95504.1 hypothetical protein [Rhodopseudomonas sp. BR0G17]